MAKQKENIVLFDMDGTLTEARQKATWSLVRPLRQLSERADLGIVTGSPMNYLEQQCGILWEELGSVDIRSFTLFPCNGTQAYKYNIESREWESFSHTDMRSHIGNNTYQQIVREILALQTSYCDQHTDMPLTGNFVSDRKSMINWCPVGRDADNDDRNLFQKFDRKHKCRETLKTWLEDALSDISIQNIECVLGGNTSIDIYPAEWDKTYVLRHLEAYKSIYFMGDRCEDLGNDKALYEALEPEVTSFKTTGPSETVQIIDNLTMLIKG